MSLSVNGTDCGNNEKYCTKFQGNYSTLISEYFISQQWAIANRVIVNNESGILANDW